MLTAGAVIRRPPAGASIEHCSPIRWARHRFLPQPTDHWLARESSARRQAVPCGHEDRGEADGVTGPAIGCPSRPRPGSAVHHRRVMRQEGGDGSRRAALIEQPD